MIFIKYFIFFAVLTYWTIEFHKTCDTIRKYINYEERLYSLEQKVLMVEEETRTTIPFIRMEAMAAKEYLDEIKDAKRSKAKRK